MHSASAKSLSSLRTDAPIEICDAGTASRNPPPRPLVASTRPFSIKLPTTLRKWFSEIA